MWILKLVVVAGAKSNVGKTTLARKLLFGLRGWSAIKVTTVKGPSCPRRISDCNICQGLTGDFEIIKKQGIINQKGTDTARLKEAGAGKVIWLKASLKGLKPGIKQALKELRDCPGAVIEGTSVLKHIEPDMAIFLKDRDKKEIRFYRGKENAGWTKYVIDLLEANEQRQY